MRTSWIMITLSSLLLGCVEAGPETAAPPTAEERAVCVTVDGLPGDDCAPASKHYQDTDDPAGTPAAFKATYTNSNNPWVAGCVVQYSDEVCAKDATPQKLDACDGAKLNEAVTDNSKDCVETKGAYAEYDCDQECKNARFPGGTCKTVAVAACGETKVGYCECMGAQAPGTEVAVPVGAVE